jgi:hypothetical protein
MLVSNTLEEALGEKVQISRRHEERSFSGSRQRSPAGVVDMPRFAWVDVDGGGLAANLLCRHKRSQKALCVFSYSVCRPSSCTFPIAWEAGLPYEPVHKVWGLTADQPIAACGWAVAGLIIATLLVKQPTPKP